MTSPTPERRQQLFHCIVTIYRQLLVENNLPVLLQSISDNLISDSLNRGAWMVLVDKESENIITAEAGLGNRFKPIRDQLKKGSLPDCCLLALKQGAVSATPCEECSCKDCAFRPSEPDTSPIAVPIWVRLDLFGFLVLQPPVKIRIEQWELDELSNLAEGISIALNKLISTVESREREGEFRRLEERYELALDASEAGLWDWNIKTGDMYTSLDRQKLVDYRDLNEENELGPAPWEGLIHPEDKPKVLSNLNDHLVGKTEEYQIEYRIKNENGEWRWFHDRGRVVDRDEQNMPLRMTGTHQDVTRQKEKDEALNLVQQKLHDTVKDERKFLQTIIDGASDPVMAIDLDFNILLINSAAGKIMQIDPEKARGQKCYEIFHLSSIPCTDSRFPCPIKHMQEKQEPITLIHNPYHGNLINNTFELEVSPLKTPDGRLNGIIEVARDISVRLKTEHELRESKTRLYRLAHHDILTGLPNRLLFRDRLERSTAKANRSETLVAILFLDLDNFKQINDSLGHDIGDELLKEVALRLQKQCRKSDTVGRLGGDEFVFLLDDIKHTDDVIRVARKILISMTKPIKIGSHELNITASIGIAVYPLDSDDIDIVIK